MADKTQNYNLTKPLPAEFYDVQVQNGNMDIIDGALKENADAAKNIQEGMKNKADLIEGKVDPEQLPDMDYEAKGTAEKKVQAHNEDVTAHPDIRKWMETTDKALTDAQQTIDDALDVIADFAYTINATPSQNGTLTYDGSPKEPVWNAFNPDNLTISGDTTGTEAGSYTVTFTPKEKYKWSDGTTEGRKVQWTIGRATVAVPTQSNGPLTYSGDAQGPTWTGYDQGKMTLDGDTSKTDAGTYRATFTLKGTNYQWPDTTTGVKTVNWTIAKAPGSLTITPEKLTLNNQTLTGKITVNRLGNGQITATSSNQGAAKVQVDGTTVTVTAVETGTSNIVISVAAGTNHLAPANKTCVASVTIYHYKTYGVEITISNSNTETALKYTGDAVGKTPKTGWANEPLFQNIKPCVVKDGVVQYYLNKADLTKRENGQPATITDPSAGDVMIEIPKIGFRITTTATTHTIEVTDNPAAAGFCYRAHSLVTEGDCDKIYVGAFLGYNDSGKLCSVSGKTPTVNQNLGTFRTQAKARGTNYELVSFYPLTLLQCLYLIKYKDRHGQNALGKGYTSASAVTTTGKTASLGEDYGTTSGTQQMCFLNIEDFWGNLFWWIDGIFCDSSRAIKTDFKNFNDSGTGYQFSKASGLSSDAGGWLQDIQGTNEGGFTAKTVSGSSSTYYADYASLYGGYCAHFGGSWNDGDNAGPFRFYVYYAASSSSSSLGARLLYKHKAA